MWRQQFTAVPQGAYEQEDQTAPDDRPQTPTPAGAEDRTPTTFTNDDSYDTAMAEQAHHASTVRLLTTLDLPLYAGLYLILFLARLWAIRSM